MLNVNLRGHADRRRGRHRAFLAAAGLAFIAGFGAISTCSAQAADAEVDIDNFSFKPDVLTVKAGAVVVFRNRDDIPHSILSADGAFHSQALDTDDTFSFAFAKPGTYVYYCGLHPQMKGEIVVAP